ncbi:hypothetical protein SARC_06298, partial [Sphaeroforma arctica JP610]
GGVLIENLLSGEAVLVLNSSISTLNVDDKDGIIGDYVKRFDLISVFGKLNTTNGATLLCVTSTHTEVRFSDGSCIYRINTCELAQVSGNSIVRDADLLKGMRALVADGSFYFASEGYDVTRSEQVKYEEGLAGVADEPDAGVMWNGALMKDFTNAQIGAPLCPPCIRGYVSFRKIYTGMTENLAGIISRSGCGRAGTRFQTRGVDDDGMVANFAETEQIIEVNGAVISYLQIRGSVPLFWEQPGINVGKHKVQIPRSMDAMMPAFEKHFTQLLPRYGPVRCLNLLEQQGEVDGEPLLSREFEVHVKELMRQQKCRMCTGEGQWGEDVSIVSFDFHKETRGSKYENLSRLLNAIHEPIVTSSYFYRPGPGATPVNRQSGVFRTNCLDCLDRTNAVMQLIGQKALQIQLDVLGIEIRHLSRFQDSYKEMWYQNGDAISMAYAGTGAMKADFTLTGKRTKKGIYNDGKKSLKRLVQNNQDDKRQAIIDVMLRAKGSTELSMAMNEKNQNKTVNQTIHRALLERSEEYCDVSGLRLCVATWNTNNGKNFDHTNLADWLVAPCEGDPPDIYAIGFQEIVNIEAKSIYKADEGNMEQWRLRITAALAQQNLKYNLLAQRQLVGVALLIFVAVPALPYVRDVVITKCNVGMHGLAGNKGGIGIRFAFRNTSICFVSAHLAAGQSNVQDRIDDYKDITKSLDFGKRRCVLDHNYVFWMGDFNFRVNLPRDVVIPAIEAGNYSLLLQNCQLQSARDRGLVFQGFEEGEIIFAPTYKYDVNSDTYDTSEKQRTPSWTDRILWRVNGESVLNSVLRYYNRVDSIRTSDHRPVVAVLDINVAIVDEQARKSVYKSLVRDGSAVEPCVDVSGLPADATPNDVRALFQPFGRVMALKLYEPGSARVTFADEDSAVSCTSLSGSSFGSRTLTINLVDPSNDDYVSRRSVDLDSMRSGSLRSRTDMNDTTSLMSDMSSYTSANGRLQPLPSFIGNDGNGSDNDNIIFGSSPSMSRASEVREPEKPYRPAAFSDDRGSSKSVSRPSVPAPARPPALPLLSIDSPSVISERLEHGEHLPTNLSRGRPPARPRAPSEESLNAIIALTGSSRGTSEGPTTRPPRPKQSLSESTRSFSTETRDLSAEESQYSDHARTPDVVQKPRPVDSINTVPTRQTIPRKPAYKVPELPQKPRQTPHTLTRRPTNPPLPQSSDDESYSQRHGNSGSDSESSASETSDDDADGLGIEESFTEMNVSSLRSPSPPPARMAENGPVKTGKAVPAKLPPRNRPPQNPSPAPSLSPAQSPQLQHTSRGALPAKPSALPPRQPPPPKSTARDSAVPVSRRGPPVSRHGPPVKAPPSLSSVGSGDISSTPFSPKPPRSPAPAPAPLVPHKSPEPRAPGRTADVSGKPSPSIPVGSAPPPSRPPPGYSGRSITQPSPEPPTQRSARSNEESAERVLPMPTRTPTSGPVHPPPQRRSVTPNITAMHSASAPPPLPAMPPRSKPPSIATRTDSSSRVTPPSLPPRGTHIPSTPTFDSDSDSESSDADSVVADQYSGSDENTDEDSEAETLVPRVPQKPKRPNML